MGFIRRIRELAGNAKLIEPVTELEVCLRQTTSKTRSGVSSRLVGTQTVMSNFLEENEITVGRKSGEGTKRARIEADDPMLRLDHATICIRDGQIFAKVRPHVGSPLETTWDHKDSQFRVLLKPEAWKRMKLINLFTGTRGTIIDSDRLITLGKGYFLTIQKKKPPEVITKEQWQRMHKVKA